MSATKSNPINVGYEKNGRFATIDFETADYGSDSACAIAIVIADREKILKKYYHLIRPPRRDFAFTYLHGISWLAVARKPTFGELWPKIRPLFDGVDFIAAHNAMFDRTVLEQCCALSDHEPLDMRYLCTMKLARCLWRIYPTRLPDVCRHLGIDLKHHDARSDAVACAKIVINAIKEDLPKSAFLL